MAFTDPPELLGDESRILGAIDVRDGQVVRWVDDWDASGFAADLHAGLRVPAEQCPTSRKARWKLGHAGRHRGLAGSPAGLRGRPCSSRCGTLAPDATCEDMALRTEVQGRAGVEGTPVHDGRLLSDEDPTALVLAALEPRS